MAALSTLLAHGQSAWLDYIDRRLISTDGLQRLIESGVRGVTSNPTIFHESIAGSGEYDAAIRELLQADPNIDDAALFEWLAIDDIQNAADALLPIYEASAGEDGFVSLEVSPHLAYDTVRTIEAARHLWKAVGRRNLMIKVPATEQGLPAIERLIAEGINVNVTLLFSVRRYNQVAQAYLRGLSMNPAPAEVASVASFFVSRIDSKVDTALQAMDSVEARSLMGRAAIANAKMAYQELLTLLDSREFRRQEERGGRVQRLLWGSTGTKNPQYSDVMYVESLIGPHTVNTLPPQTLDAFIDHGQAGLTVEQSQVAARRELEHLAGLGIHLEQVAGELEREGVAKFAQSYDALLAALAEKRSEAARRFASG